MAPVAQGIEQLPSKQWVRGSIPRGRARKMKYLIILFFIFFYTQSFADETYDLWISGNKIEAIQKWRGLSDQGNIDAKYALAILYNDASSIGICEIEDFCIFENSNYKKAYKLFLELYNLEDPRAAYSIGEYYDDHWVFWPNYKKAFKYFLFAAERGVPEAQYNVANMYEHGDGVKRDLVQSIRWYLQCNKSSLCGAGEEGISDLIEQVSEEDFLKAKSLVVDDLEEIDIRITSVR